MLYNTSYEFAGLVKLVYTPDLGSGIARCESSSLSSRTILRKHMIIKDNEKNSRREVIKDGKVDSWVTKALIEYEIAQGKQTKAWGFYK